MPTAAQCASSSTGPGDDWFPAWSPDGTIAFVRGTDGAQIWVVVEGEAPVLLADPPAGRYFRSPAWAHDGSVLAVWGDAEEAGNDDLYALFPDGRLQRITFDPVVDRNPTWSPDGSMLAFVRDQGRSGSADNDIWTLDVATGSLRQLTQNNVQDGNPVWSPDGTQIAFYQATGDNGFHIHVLGATEEGSIDLMDGRPGQEPGPELALTRRSRRSLDRRLRSWMWIARAIRSGPPRGLRDRPRAPAGRTRPG